MAKDDPDYSDKPFSPGSLTDPRNARGAAEPENPKARETYPGGGESASGGGGSTASKAKS